jgi:hypothetical protein
VRGLFVAQPPSLQISTMIFTPARTFASASGARSIYSAPTRPWLGSSR